MVKNKYFLIVIIFFLTGLFLINRPPNNIHRENIKYVKIAGQNIKVDLAVTEKTRAQGLSGRKELKENEGMLFFFNRSGNYPFWMKDMNFPIDIIWINKNKEVIYIKKDARPELYPEIYRPEKNDQNAKYILEIVSGFSDKNNLKIGDKIEFLP